MTMLVHQAIVKNQPNAKRGCTKFVTYQSITNYVKKERSVKVNLSVLKELIEEESRSGVLMSGPGTSWKLDHGFRETALRMGLIEGPKKKTKAAPKKKAAASPKTSKANKTKSKNLADAEEPVDTMVDAGSEEPVDTMVDAGSEEPVDMVNSEEEALQEVAPMKDEEVVNSEEEAPATPENA